MDIYYPEDKTQRLPVLSGFMEGVKRAGPKGNSISL